MVLSPQSRNKLDILRSEEYSENSTIYTKFDLNSYSVELDFAKAQKIRNASCKLSFLFTNRFFFFFVA